MFTARAGYILKLTFVNFSIFKSSYVVGNYTHYEVVLGILGQALDMNGLSSAGDCLKFWFFDWTKQEA